MRKLGLQEYMPVWDAMQTFTAERNESSLDEVWLLQHYPVYTQGRNGKSENILEPGSVPVIPVDRGGQVTYHGPGQLVAYTLIDLKRKHWGVRQLISAQERAVIDLLAGYGITARSRLDAPGVYVEEKKIASLGLRVRRGCAYHGLSLNVDMDLSPFTHIHPCGHKGLEVTQMSQLCNLDTSESYHQIGITLTDHLARHLGYDKIKFEAGFDEHKHRVAANG